jgi:hypothetical protein
MVSARSQGFGIINVVVKDSWSRVVLCIDFRRSSCSFHLFQIRAFVEADHDPIATARKARKERIEKNTRQAARNAADALAANSTSTSNATSSTRPGVSTLSQAQKKTLREARKEELDRSMALSRTATASMGKFDKKIEGEPKIKGVKRKVSVAVWRFWFDKVEFRADSCFEFPFFLLALLFSRIPSKSISMPAVRPDLGPGILLGERLGHAYRQHHR